MKAKDIKVGGEYFTYVSGERILVRVVRDRGRPGPYQRGRYQVERVDNRKLLTKWRSPQALHPGGEGPWPGMTEKQEMLGFEEVKIFDLNILDYGSEDSGAWGDAVVNKKEVEWAFDWRRNRWVFVIHPQHQLDKNILNKKEALTLERAVKRELKRREKW